MPKSVPKQKPLATKKNKLPKSILGLLGLALVLVGIVAAIGLVRINQDDRSNASSNCPWLNKGGSVPCDTKKAGKQGILTVRKNTLERPTRPSATASPSQSRTAIIGNKSGGTQSTAQEQATGVPAGEPQDTTASNNSAGTSAGDSNNSQSEGSSGTSSSKKTLGQPIGVTAMCSGDKMQIKWRMENGTADSFILAANSTALVPGSSQCPTLRDGWRCEGDIQNEIKKSAANCNSKGECSAKISVERTHWYNSVAVRAVKGGATKVGQASVNLKCN